MAVVTSLLPHCIPSPPTAREDHDAASLADTGGATRDGPPVDLEPDGGSCDLPRTRCDGTCVDLATRADHCGRCGHDCVGGACTMGRCEPFVVDRVSSYGVLVAASESYVYWSGSGGRLARCALEGCGPGGPELLLEPRPGREMTGLTAALGGVVLARRVEDDAGDPLDHELTVLEDGGARRLTRGPCPVEIAATADELYAKRCSDGIVRLPTPFFPYTVMVDADGGASENITSIAASSAGPFWTTRYGDVRRCSGADCAGSRVTLASAQELPGKLAVFAGNAYWASGTRDSISIARCAVTGCPAGPTVLHTASGTVNALVVDASGIYWTQGTAAGPAGSRLLHCPLAGCGERPEVLHVQDNLDTLATTGAFVFVTVAFPGALLRLAK